MQQKYCDHGRSTALLRIVWPIFLARSSCGWGGVPRNASIFPWTKSSVGLTSFSQDPLDIVDGIEPDIGGHEGQPHVSRVVETINAHPLAPQIRDAADALVGDQFEASRVQPG